MAAPGKEGGLCSQIWNSTLKGGAAAAFWAFAARATATRCFDEWSGLLLGAAPAMSLGEDNSWRSLGAAAASACVWAFFCVVGALSALAAALNTFGSSARRSGWNARLVGVLLASTARLAAAGPANASVAPFSDDIKFSRTRRKLRGYVFAEHVPTEFENDMHYLQDAAGEDVEPLVEEGGGGHDGHDHGRRRLDDGHDHGASGYVMDDVLIRPTIIAWFDDRAVVEADYGHISTWDTSGVTDMAYLFCAIPGWSDCNTAALSFNEDISAWDTSSVTSMYMMFVMASSFNQPIGKWSVDSVTSMEMMFDGDPGNSAFDQDLGWCVADDVDLRYAFRNTPCEPTYCGVTRKNEFDECEAIVDDDAYDIFVVDDDKDDDDDYDDDDDCGYGSLCNDAATTRSAALAALVIGAAL